MSTAESDIMALWNHLRSSSLQGRHGCFLNSSITSALLSAEFCFLFFTRTVAISCFPRAQLSVMDLQVTTELSFILTGLRCQPFGFSLASSISLVDAKFTSFSNKRLKDFNFFFPLVFPKVVVEGLKANPIQGEKTLCEVYNMDPYYWNTTLMKAGLLACVNRANRALHVLVNNTGSCTKRRKSQREPLYSCQSATSPIKIGGENSSSPSRCFMLSHLRIMEH